MLGRDPWTLTVWSRTERFGPSSGTGQVLEIPDQLRPEPKNKNSGPISTNSIEYVSIIRPNRIGTSVKFFISDQTGPTKNEISNRTGASYKNWTFGPVGTRTWRSVHSWYWGSSYLWFFRSLTLAWSFNVSDSFFKRSMVDVSSTIVPSNWNKIKYFVAAKFQVVTSNHEWKIEKMANAEKSSQV